MFKMSRQSASHLKNFQSRNLFYDYTSWFWSTLIPVLCKIKIIFKVLKYMHFHWSANVSWINWTVPIYYVKEIPVLQRHLWGRIEPQRTSECSKGTSEASSDSRIDVYLWGRIPRQWTHISDCSVACVWLLVTHTLIYYDTVSEWAILIIWEDDPYLKEHLGKCRK